MSQTSNMDVTAVLTAMTDAERSFVPLAVDSVLCQTRRCHVILCVADENVWIDSMDLDADITILRLPFAPPGVVRNAAVGHSDTKWIAFLDSDDLWEPRKLERQVTIGEREGVPIVGCDYVFIDDEGRAFAHDLGRFYPMTSTWLIERRLLVDQPFRTDLVGDEDGEWWHRSLRLAVPRRRVPEFLVRYRVREGALSIKPRKETLKRIAKWPLMRPPMLLGTRLVHRLFRSTTYRNDPTWDLDGEWVSRVG